MKGEFLVIVATTGGLRAYFPPLTMCQRSRDPMNLRRHCRKRSTNGMAAEEKMEERSWPRVNRLNRKRRSSTSPALLERGIAYR
jgi:hypothetical protein